MADQPVTITREKYERAIQAGRTEFMTIGGTFESGLKTAFAAVGVQVERTPEERIAAFLCDPVIRGWRTDDPQHWLARKIREHFGD